MIIFKHIKIAKFIHDIYRCLLKLILLSRQLSKTEALFIYEFLKRYLVFNIRIQWICSWLIFCNLDFSFSQNKVAVTLLSILYDLITSFKSYWFHLGGKNLWVYVWYPHKPLIIQYQLIYVFNFFLFCHNWLFLEHWWFVPLGLFWCIEFKNTATVWYWSLYFLKFLEWFISLLYLIKLPFSYVRPYIARLYRWRPINSFIIFIIHIIVILTLIIFQIDNVCWEWWAHLRRILLLLNNWLQSFLN